MSKIDDLYKRAFGSSEYSYDNSNWEKMESLLDETIPISKTQSWFSKVASIALIGGLSITGILFNAPNEISAPPLAISFNNEMDLQNELPNNDNLKLASKPSSANAKMEIVKPLANEINSKSIQQENKIFTTTPTASHSKNDALAQIQKPEKSTTLVMNNHPNKKIDNFFTPTKKEEKMVERKSNETATGISQNQLGATRTFTSLAFITPKNLPQNPNVNTELLKLNLKKYKSRIRLKTSPKITLGLSVITENLDNDKDLNVNVSEEIKNVALAEGKNNNLETGINIGMKWKGLVLSSGIMLKQQNSEYNIFYSHTSSWQKQNIETETSFSGINKTYIKDEISTVIRDGEKYFIRTPVYQIDSTYETTADTTYQTQYSTSELDEKFAYKLNYVSIPLNVGYEHKLNHFFVSVNVGMNMSFLTGVTGKIYNSESNSVIDFTDKSELNSVVYSANAAVGLGYDITPQLAFTVQPRITKSLNSSFKENSDLATTYQGVGANFILRYSF